MENLVIGFNVTPENREDSQIALLGNLDRYMNKETRDSLIKGFPGLLLFDVESKTLRKCDLLEADAVEAFEDWKITYVSMSSHSPREFVDRVLKELDERESALNAATYDPYKAEELVMKRFSVSDDSTNTDPSVSVKNDRKDHKVRWDLVPMEPINEIAKVYTAGADKYGPDRWQNLEDGFNRYRGAACRHLFEYMQGNRYDEETKCMHLAQAAWNLIAMIWLDMHGKGLFPFEELKEMNSNKAFDKLMEELKNAKSKSAEAKEKSTEN